VGAHLHFRQAVLRLAPARRHASLAEAEHVARVAVCGGVTPWRDDGGLRATPPVVVPAVVQWLSGVK